MDELGLESFSELHRFSGSERDRNRLRHEEGRLVPEGETGELFLIPPALGMSQRLLNASHDEVCYEGCPKGPHGDVLRRHGDPIEVLPGGGYKAQGRADDTMNLGGIKVGSLELERVVNEHPAVLESAAVGVSPKEGGAEKLVLYVVLREPADPDRLKRELAETIAPPVESSLPSRGCRGPRRAPEDGVEQDNAAPAPRLALISSEEGGEDVS